MRTGYDLVWLAAERTPHRPALIDDITERTLTYSQLVEEVETIAAGMSNRGIVSGAFVATALPNTFEHCLALLALQRIGAVPAPMNFRLPPAQIAAAVVEGRMLGAVVTPNASEDVRRALPEQGVLLTCGEGGNFSDCRRDRNVLAPRPTPNSKETGMVFYTSGTTGAPKAALIPHCASEPRVNWLSPVAGVVPERDLRTLGLAPLFHALGYIAFHSTLAFGGTFVAMSAFDAARASRLIENHHITFLFTVPTIFQALLSSPGYRAERFASVKKIIMGGSAVSPKLLDRLSREWSAKIGHGYGTTEVVCPLFQRDPVGRPRTFECTYGSRVRVVRIGCNDPEDVCPIGHAGELIVEAREDHVFTGYLSPIQTAEKLRSGWYFTGDVGIKNTDGSFDVVGRTDDVIRSGAENIYPEEVEAVLAKHPAVREVCAIGISDELWGERVVACIVSGDPGVPWQAYDSFCVSEGLASFKRPKAYVLMTSLPRNAMNKIERKTLRQAVAERGCVGPDGMILVAA